MTIEIDTSDFLDLLNELSNVGSTVMQLMGADFWAESVLEAPVREGTLRGSIQATVQDNYQWIVGTDLEYALFVHDGTRAHDIGSPVYIGGGEWRYIGRSPTGKGKPHPGTEANPFFDRATDTIEGRLEEYLTMAVEMIQ